MRILSRVLTRPGNIHASPLPIFQTLLTGQRNQWGERCILNGVIAVFLSKNAVFLSLQDFEVLRRIANQLRPRVSPYRLGAAQLWGDDEDLLGTMITCTIRQSWSPEEEVLGRYGCVNYIRVTVRSMAVPDSLDGRKPFFCVFTLAVAEFPRRGVMGIPES